MTATSVACTTLSTLFASHRSHRFCLTPHSHACYCRFSNFWSCQISVKGQQYKTVEHFFQSEKFRDPEHRQEVRAAPTAMEAARRGRDRKRPLRPDWEAIKDNVMYQAVKAKFTQHSNLAKILLGTGARTIIEHTKNDSYWGDGGNGSGRPWSGLGFGLGGVHPS